MNKKTTIFLWILSFVMTVTIALYQRWTGPTYPFKGVEKVGEAVVKYRLLRSFTEFEQVPAAIHAPDQDVTAQLVYRRYKADDPWTSVGMTRNGEMLEGRIPGQARAGKVEYNIRLAKGDDQVTLNNGRSLVLRFKGAVPTFVLIIHVLFMFASIWLAFRTGLEALRKNPKYDRLVNWTLGTVFIGGMILGPIVQKFAFSDFWTGFPFGTDLTDNKTLLAVIFWIAAFFLKNRSKWWVLVATIMMVVVYLIPHSVMGSELDYKSGKMKNKYGYHYIQEAPAKTVVS